VIFYNLPISLKVRGGGGGKEETFEKKGERKERKKKKGERKMLSGTRWKLSISDMFVEKGTVT